MKEKHDWREQIPGIFGVQDLELGLHPTDEKRFVELVLAARAQGATVDDFRDAIVAHVLAKDRRAY